MKTVMSIVGARPQFIKAAVVSRALASAGLPEIMLHTGQHYDFNMSGLFFDELCISAPKYNLEVGSGPHGMQTGRMLEGIEKVLQEVLPEMVLTYGDTNSTLAGALAAAKLHVPIAHVEAGLRSFNRQMPEEINRVVTDHTADLLFAPTTTAVRNLEREGIPCDRIIRTGDVMYDVALKFAAAEKTGRILQRLGLSSRGYILATLHRNQNTDDTARLHTILESLAQIAEQVAVILPLHPRTRKAIKREQAPPGLDRITIIEPLGYLDMLGLETHACLIVTDSGGVQKEAYFHHVPCVTLRKETEWLESLEGGCNRLVPPSNSAVIIGAIRASLASTPSFRSDLYGDGHSAERIADFVANWKPAYSSGVASNAEFSPQLTHTEIDQP
jgi:UDP-GlcNAc3NAcA epimerase